MSSTGLAMKRLHDALQHDQAGRSAEAMRSASDALAAFSESGDRTGTAAAHHLLASLHEERSESEQAIHHAEAAAAIRLSTGDYDGLIPLLHMLLHLHREDAAATRQICDRLLTAYANVNERERIATGLLQVARALLAVGAADAIQPVIERGLWFSDRAGEERFRTSFLQISAQRDIEVGGAERAVRQAMEAVSVARQAGARPVLADALHMLGVSLHAAGQLPRAREVLEEALDLREALRDPMGRALELDLLARVEVAEGRVADAVDRLVYLARIWGSELGDPLQELEALHRAGEHASEAGLSERAVALARRQVDLARSLDAPDMLAASWHVLANREIAMGDLESAALSFTESMRARREAGQDEAAAVAAGMLGQVLDALGRREEATAILNEAEATLRRLGSPNLEALHELLRER